MIACAKPGNRSCPGGNGDPISASGSGERCARTTARAATPGTISATTRPARAPIAGARTGSAGISDDKQRLCFALALWNGKDPILKERLFGLTNSEGNHGEDVKEYYFYLDSTPTHSYMKYLYKYPQARFSLWRSGRDQPRRAGAHEFEYELLDTGVFDEDRYFDVFVEYAKAVARRHPDPDHGPQSRAGGGRAARPADALVPQPWSWGTAPSNRPMLQPDRRRARAHRHRRERPQAGRAITSIATATRDAAVHRERNQHAAHLRRPQPHPLCQGRHQQLRRPRQGDAVNPAKQRHQGRGALSPDAGARRIDEWFACA